MKVHKFAVEGPLLVELQSFGDSRGFFVERFRKDQFSEIGLNFEYVQENFSKSAPGVLRGLHYQYDKPQGKLVTCTMGKIWDVAVDIRKDSSTFGKHVAVTIDSDKPAWFWIPPGFAHGFCILEEQSAGLWYKVNNYYNAQGEGGISWNDPDLAIAWPLTEPTISSRDMQLPSFNEYRKNPLF